MIKNFLKKYPYYIFLFFLAIFFFTLDWIPLNERSNYIKAGYDKLELLAGVKSPRMIFSGGSSVAFGVDTKKINQKVHYNCINMGLHILRGLIFI